MPTAAVAAERARAAERHNRLRALGLVWRRRGVTLRRCRRGLVAFLTSDKYIGAALEHMGEVNERDFALLRHLVRPGDAVVDAGANVGVYALFFAQRVTARGHVLSIEPQPRVARLLQANMALNGCHHVRVREVALGDAEGVLQIPMLDYARENNFGGVSVRQRPGGTNVRVCTLDSFRFKRCDFIKMDVEGMEPAVFAGALATIRQHRPVLWMESDRPGATERLAAMAQQEGYRCWELKIAGERARNFYRKPRSVFVERYGYGFITMELLALPPGRSEPPWIAAPPEGVSVRWLG